MTFYVENRMRYEGLGRTKIRLSVGDDAPCGKEVGFRDISLRSLTIFGSDCKEELLRAILRCGKSNANNSYFR